MTRSRPDRLSRPRPSRARAGLSLMETLLALAITGVMTAFLFNIVSDRSTRNRAEMAGRKITAVARAAEDYVTERARLIEGWTYADGSGPLSVPDALSGLGVGESARLPLAELVGGGYLPAGDDGAQSWRRDTWGHRISVHVRRKRIDDPTTDAGSGTGDAGLQVLVTASADDASASPGPAAIARTARAVEAMAAVGSSAASFPEAATDAVADGDLAGIDGTWNADPSAWGAPAGGGTIRVAALSRLHAETAMPHGLDRGGSRAKLTPPAGMERARRMDTDLHMGDRIIRGIGELVLEDVDDAGGNACRKPDGSGTIPGCTLDTSDRKAPTRAGSMIMGVGEYSASHSGDSGTVTVRKPECGPNRTPTIAATPRAVSDENGLPIKQYSTWAEDAGNDFWKVHLQVVTTRAPGNPNQHCAPRSNTVNCYGPPGANAIVVATKCRKN